MVFRIHPLLVFLLQFLLQLLLAKSQPHPNISLGSSLSALDNSSSWLSPSGDFAFGFQPMGADSFLLATWFNKIPERTIVWTAYQGNVVQRGSTVQLTNAGELVLNGPGGEALWKSDQLTTSVAYAALLDTGNFVLVGKNSSYAWATFDRPTDTLLPSQTLPRSGTMHSRLTETNYTSGRFQFQAQNNGQFVMSTMAYPTTYVNYPYWQTNETAATSQMVFDAEGNIYISLINKTLVTNLSSPITVPTKDFYHRAVFDYDGVFRHYVYPRNTESNNTGWSESWSTMWFVPPNICVIADGFTGSGACGYNSYCRLDDNQRTECVCPPGFSYLDPADKFAGCKQDFDVPQSCGEESQGAGLFEIREVLNTDWPRCDSDFFLSKNEDWCRKACLNNCLCPVAVFKDGICWFKRYPLSNGRMDVSVGGKALIKVRRDNSSSICSKKKKKSQFHSVVIVSILLGASCCLNLGISFFTFGLTQKRPKKIQLNQVTLGMNLLNFTYKELEDATDGFKEELGHGAFATVYKGVLKSDGKNLVAVKNLETVSESDEEFLREVNAIGQTNHKNLVQLLGFCNEASHRLLVYQFMSNGSLASFLFQNPRPKWFQRIRIAYGIARGLMYLHEECSSQIIHCDIKPQNILLDDLFTARISDFGLAKLLKADQTHTTTGLRGTMGYVAPEWFKDMAITTKVDVYSFGVVLLEIIFCRRNVESNGEDGDMMILSDMAYDCYKEGRLDVLLEHDEEAIDDMKKVRKLVMIAIWCIQEDPSLRPSMKKVTQMMEGAAQVSPPPDPSSFMSSIS